MVVAIVSLLLAVCAAGAATYLWFELDDVRTKSAQDTIVTSIKVATVDGRVDSLEGDSEHFDSLAGRVANLESSIATAEQDIIDNVESDSDASDAIEALGWCINAYIDYVENGIGPYYYC